MKDVFPQDKDDMTTQGLEDKIKTNNQWVAIILLMNKLQLGIMIPIRN